jgi:hypothetical protein
VFITNHTVRFHTKKVASKRGPIASTALWSFAIQVKKRTADFTCLENVAKFSEYPANLMYFNFKSASSLGPPTRTVFCLQAWEELHAYLMAKVKLSLC